MKHLHFVFKESLLYNAITTKYFVSSVAEHKMPAPVCVDQFEEECPKVKRFCQNGKFSLSIQTVCPKTCNTCHHTEHESGVHEEEEHTVAILWYVGDAARMSDIIQQIDFYS